MVVNRGGPACLPADRQPGGCLWSSLTWGQMRTMAPSLEASSSIKKVDLIVLIRNKKSSSSVLVCELVCISIHPVLWRESHFIEVAAVIAAFTRLDEHSRPLETLAVWADKGHR